MSQEVKYICNLCRDAWKAGPAEGGIIGLSFGSGASFKEAPLWECQTHICMNCLGEVEKLIKKRRSS